MPRKKAKKDLCTAQISFRCTPYEKNKIKNLAAKKGIQQKEFIMNSIDYSEKMSAKETKKERNQAAYVCEVQSLVNHLKRNHQNDVYVEEVCKKLWDLVN